MNLPTAHSTTPVNYHSPRLLAAASPKSPCTPTHPAGASSTPAESFESSNRLTVDTEDSFLYTYFILFLGVYDYDSYDEF